MLRDRIGNIPPLAQASLFLGDKTTSPPLFPPGPSFSPSACLPDPTDMFAEWISWGLRMHFMEQPDRQGRERWWAAEKTRRMKGQTGGRRCEQRKRAQMRKGALVNSGGGLELGSEKTTRRRSSVVYSSVLWKIQKRNMQRGCHCETQCRMGAHVS